MARYSTLLENPRRRRRSTRRRRKARSSRRRSNPFVARRRKGGRRRGGRRRSNPFRLPGLGSGVIGKGIELYLGRVVGKLAIGLASKVSFIDQLDPRIKALGLGLLMPMVPVGGKLKTLLHTAGALTIAGGIAGATSGLEQRLYDAIGVNAPDFGLGDYVTDSGMGEYGLLGNDDADYGTDQYLNDYVTDMG